MDFDTLRIDTTVLGAPTDHLMDLARIGYAAAKADCDGRGAGLTILRYVTCVWSLEQLLLDNFRKQIRPNTFTNPH